MINRTSRLSTLCAFVAVVVACSAVLRPDRPRRATLSPERAGARDRMIAKLKTNEAEREGQGPRYDKPDEAMAFYWAKRSPDTQPMSVSELEEAAEAVAEMPVVQRADGAYQAHTTDVPLSGSSAASSASGTLQAWQPLGPGNIGGRSRALLIHDKKPHLMWTAGVAGGIWKSSDGGASWQPKADLLVNIAINSMIQDPKEDNVLYAGTGEGFFNADGVRGQGIFKSVDFGETWTQLPSTNNSDFFFVQKLAATRHPNKKRIYAATRTGVFRSSDFGATWSKVLDGTAVNGCMDLAIHQKLDDETAPRYVFASCGTLAQATVYRALDVEVGQVWEPVLSQPLMGRTSLALSESNPNVVYALASYYRTGDALNYKMRAVYRSADSGATWEERVSYTDPNKLNTVQLTNPVYAFLADCGYGSANQFFNQGWYDNQIAVDPHDENVVWTAGIDLMRSDDGGRNWGIASYWWFDPGDPNYAHADNHAITFHPKYNGSNNRQLFVASDGGVHRTDDARAPVGTTQATVCGEPVANQVSWTSLNNGYQVTQYYHGTVYPDGNTFFGGTQDNGTLRGSFAGGQNWDEILGGDGGYVAVNTANTNILYAENTGKSLQRSSNGGTSFTLIATAASGLNDASGNYQFIHPFAMDPTNSSRLWYGGAQAFRSDNGGTTWVRASQFFASRVASWAVAPSNANRVYAGVQNLGTATSGLIFTTDVATTATASTVWTVRQPRQGYVSSLAVDPANPLIAYATYSTYNSGTNIGHVFKTTNGGLLWTRIDLTLPDMPVHSVVVHPTSPNTLYIGTDLGVFVTTDGGVSWLRENVGFANVITEHLQIQNGRLYAFTHGRSAWSVDLTPTP
jgi:hypothetical protein